MPPRTPARRTPFSRALHLTPRGRHPGFGRVSSTSGVETLQYSWAWMRARFFLIPTRPELRGLSNKVLQSLNTQRTADIMFYSFSFGDWKFIFAPSWFYSAKKMTSFNDIFLFFIHFFCNNTSSQSPQTNKKIQRSLRGGVKTLTRICTQFSPAHPQKRRLQRLRRLGLLGGNSFKKVDCWWITFPLRILAIIKGFDLRLRFLWQLRLGVRLKK